MKIVIGIALIYLLLSGCSPTPATPAVELIQTGIAQTLAAQVTDTVTPSPAPSNTPTQTETPIPTATETATPSPTPDIRVIEGSPQKHLLQKADLPAEGKYYLPNENWIGHGTNELTVSNWTVEKGREYLARTGRVDGWWVYYDRGTRTVYMPGQIFCNVVFYKTTEGAQIALVDYNRVKVWPDEGFTIVDKKISLGDKNLTLKATEITSGGDTRLWYEIEFTYYNVLVTLRGYGLEKDVTHEFVESAARSVLNRLQGAELAFPPTPTQVIK